MADRFQTAQPWETRFELALPPHLARRTDAAAVGIQPHADQQLADGCARARRGPPPQQFARDKGSNPAGLLAPKGNAHCGPRRSASQHRRYATGFARDQWKLAAELETSQDSSPLQCTHVRRFRNSATESFGRLLHSFLPPDFPKSHNLKLDVPSGELRIW